MAEEIIRRLTISATSTGIDETTGKMKKLADESNNVATVTDTSAKRALSAESAFQKLTSTIDYAARAQSLIEKGTRTLNAALAQGVITQDEYNRSLGLLKEKYTEVEGAGEGVSEGFRSTGLEAASVANHVKQAAAAAYTLSPAFRALVNPAIAAGLAWTGSILSSLSPIIGAIATSIIGRLLPALSLISRVLLPITLLHAEIKLIGFAWSSAGEQIAKYNELSKDTATLGTTPEYLQRFAKGFETAGGKIADATELLKKFNEASQAKLGGSDVQKKIESHIEAGNLSKGSGAGFASAIDTPEKIKAVEDLLAKMVAANKTLAAIDLSQTAFGTAATENFRKNTDYYREMREAAEKVADNKLIKQQDIDDAVILQKRYDEAVKILSERWIPFQEKITAGGVAMQRVWVGIIELIATAVTGISNFAAKIGELIGSVPKLGTAMKAMAESALNVVTFGTYGVGKAAVRALSGPDAMPVDDARSRLASGLSNPNSVAAGRDRATGVSNLFRPDTSKALDVKPVEEYIDAVDRAINSTQKHVLQQEAMTKAVGLGAGALARLKVEAAETAATLANGGNITTEQSAKFAQLKIDAENAAIALEKARVASDISRGKQMAFLSAEDVQIANQLKGLYGDDIPRALESTEAAAIRANNVMKSINDLVRSSAASFANEFVSGLVKGKTAMESLGAAARNLSSSLTTGAINSLIQGNWVMAAVQGVGAVISGIFGASQEEDEENARRAQAAADAAAKAIKDAQDRTKQYNDMAATSGFDTSTVAGQIAAFDVQAQQMRADEAEKGNGAIVALENSLAKQRQAIVDKSNKAIAKSMTDFLDSIKTGTSSILSPEDQLKYAQSQFNKDVTAGRGGDEAALNRITQDAQRLLDIAQSFYASGAGYTTIYQGVTDALSGLASRDNIRVGALAANTTEVNDPFADTKSRGMAAGGIVGNGRYNIDSVMASYAGGGNIKLAGGEHVTRATSVNQATRSSLDYINRTGRNPGGDNSEVVRVLTQGFNGQTTVLADRLDNIADRLKKLEDTTRQNNNQRRVPGVKAA